MRKHFWRAFIYALIGSERHYKAVSSTKINPEVQCNSNQNTHRDFMEFDKVILKFIPKSKDLRKVKIIWGTSLVVQWLRLHTPNAGGLGSIPGQGTGSHMPQLKIPHAAINTRCSQINK